MPKTTVRVAAAAAVALLLGAATPLAAHADVTYDSGDYSFTKISHPDQPLKSPDGIVDFNGAPDRAQSYSWSAVGHGDDVYVGTCYAAVYTTIRMMGRQAGIDQKVLDAGLKALWNGHLFVDPADPFVTRGVIVKMNTKTGALKVIDSPHKNTNYRSAIEFKGKLYFASTMPSLVEIDPANNDAARVIYSVPRPSDPGISSGIRGLAVVNGELVSSMISDAGASIISSPNPSAGQSSFRVIATQKDLFDYPANRYTDSIFGGSIWDIVPFNGKMYVSIVTGKAGDKRPFALVRGTEGTDGKWAWEAIAGDPADGAEYPFGLGAKRSGAANLVVFDNHLYIGGYNDPMVALPGALMRMQFQDLYKDLSSPVKLWKMGADEKVKLVAGDTDSLFPTRTGNFGSGLGSNSNQYIWRMTEYDGKLFVGTFDVSSLAYPLGQFANGDILRMTPEEWKTQIQYLAEFIKLLREQSATPAQAAEAAETPETPDAGIVAANMENVTATEPEALAELADGVEAVGDRMDAMTDDLVAEPKAAAKSEDIEARKASAEDFLGELQLLEKDYAAVREQLPTEAQEGLDALLSTEQLDNFKAFIGVMRYLRVAERGFDLLVSTDGDNLKPITRNGFGDPYNHGLRVFAETNQGLTIGTANPFYGTQLWLLKGKGGGGGTPTDPSTPPTTDPSTPPTTDPTTPTTPLPKPTEPAVRPMPPKTGA